MKTMLATLLTLTALALVPAGMVTSPVGAEPPQQDAPRLEFTAFADTRRDANAVFNSVQVPVIEGDRRLQITVADQDWWVNEPESTIVYIVLERCDGIECYPMVRGEFHGLDGVVPPKPHGRLSTNIDGIPGQQIRVTFHFVSEDRTEKFLVSARIE